MSLIPCTSGCVYQADGLCSLQRTVSCGAFSSDVPAGCVHFVAQASNLGGEEGVADGFDHG